ncbi:MAG: hypothetical protein WC843_00250 [Candidatus Gracilibacteria bacterium]|jgi:hypothetical protein
MSNKDKIRGEVGEKDSLMVRGFHEIVGSTEKTFSQIQHLVRTLLMATVAASITGCDSSIPLEMDKPAECVSTAPASPKVKKVDVCFMRWSEPDFVDLTDELRAQLNAEFAETTKFYLDATYGHDKYDFELIDSGAVWTGPAPQESLPDEEEDSAIEACAPQIDDFKQIDTFVVFPSISAGDRSWGGRKTFHTPQGDIEMGIIRLPNRYQKNSTKPLNLDDLKHELGHTRLWNHAKEEVCYDNEGKQIAYSPDPSMCSLDEYGNPYDVMGGRVKRPDGKKIFGHPGAFFKLSDSLVTATTIVENSGEYPLAALEVSCGNVPQLLTIPYSDTPLCLEYRQPIGIDESFSKENIKKIFGFEAGLPEDGCVFLEFCSNPSNPTTTLLMQNDGGNSNDPGAKIQLNACIPREGFSAPNLGIDISYTQSTINPDVVIVRVAGVDENRLAK